MPSKTSFRAIWISACIAVPAHADIIDVPGDQPTIADAVDAAQGGDTIRIAAGTYEESDIFTRTPDLLIIGETDASGEPLVTIDANGAGIIFGFGVVGGDGATIENLVLTGSVGNAVWIYHHAPTVRNCTFTANASSSVGIAVWAMDTEARFENCRFIDNSGAANVSIMFSGGVDEGDPGPTIENTTFCNNHGDVIDIAGTWTDGGGNTFADECVELCIGDLNGDGVVDGGDLGIMLAYWGSCGKGPCPADFNGDGAVDGADLGLILSAWGDCL